MNNMALIRHACLLLQAFNSEQKLYILLNEAKGCSYNKNGDEDFVVIKIFVVALMECIDNIFSICTYSILTLYFAIFEIY